MNAYELADYLDNKANTFTGTLLEDSATMLRQQAKRIEELESHKELSDEEINKCMECLPTHMNSITDDNLRYFAREIIKTLKGE